MLGVQAPRGGFGGFGECVYLVGGSFGADGFVVFAADAGLVAASAGSWCWGDPGVDDVVAGEGVVDGQEEVEGVGAGLGDGDVGAGAGEPLGLGVGVDPLDEEGAAAVDRGVGEGDHQQHARHCLGAAAVRIHPVRIDFFHNVLGVLDAPARLSVILDEAAGDGGRHAGRVDEDVICAIHVARADRRPEMVPGVVQHQQ